METNGECVRNINWNMHLGSQYDCGVSLDKVVVNIPEEVDRCNNHMSVCRGAHNEVAGVEMKYMGEKKEGW